MRIAIVIPHHYSETYSDDTLSGQRHGSNTAGQRTHRRRTFCHTLRCLRGNFACSQAVLQIVNRSLGEANGAISHEVSITVVVSGDQHLVEPKDRAEFGIEVQQLNLPPKELGFAAGDILRQHAGDFDIYGYIEDDLWIHDPWFFRKLDWFHRNTPSEAVLQPNRYETSLAGPVGRCYVDGDITPQATERFQNISVEPVIQGRFLDQPILWKRPLNPHSGCHFLSRQQWQHYCKVVPVGWRDSSFIGPLESAATLGVARTFRVYKPSNENAAFLELEHGDARFIQNIR